MSQHIPRRSGVGIRQAIPAAKPKAKRRKFRSASPVTCGAPNPDRAGIVDDETGELLVSPIFCGAVLDSYEGEYLPHRGDHRARVLRGVVVRWAVEVSS